MRLVRPLLAVLFIFAGIIQASRFIGQQAVYPPIVYVAKSPASDELRLYDLNTGFQLSLAQRESIGVVDVAPNLELLATTHAQVGSILNLIDPAQQALVEVVHGVDDNPMWSPTADRVAYRRYYYQGGLYVFTRGQWPPRPLDIRATAISWSPDGRVLAYSRWNELSNQEEVRTIDPVTRADTLLGGWLKPVRFMRWSPGGAQIALVTIAGDLYMLDVASQHFTPLFEDSGQMRSVQWLDDHHVGAIFTSNRRTELVIYGLDGHIIDRFSVPELDRTSSFDWFLR